MQWPHLRMSGELRARWKMELEELCLHVDLLEVGVCEQNQFIWNGGVLSPPSAPQEEESGGDVQKLPALVCAGCRTGASFGHSSRSVSFACQQVNAGTKPLQRLQLLSMLHVLT